MNIKKNGWKTVEANSMESAVDGTMMGNLGMKRITFKDKAMESAVGGTTMDNFGLKIITFMAIYME